MVETMRMRCELQQIASGQWWLFRGWERSW